MKEKIYTIPVTDAFNEDCECPLCMLNKKLEDELIEYFLGPSLMEPDCRIETNEKGFCRVHFERLYNRQENRLGLGLMIDTHLCEQNKKLKSAVVNKVNTLKKDSEISLLKSISNKLSSKVTDTEKLVDDVIGELIKLESKCAICGKLDYTMDRYTDVILFLWFKEKDFREKFNSKKGFCLNHFKMLLEGTKKYLSPKESALFLDSLLNMQLNNMERIQQEVNWFTKKFDYRYNNESWGNSRDAVPRSIQKIVGVCDLK